MRDVFLNFLQLSLQFADQTIVILHVAFVFLFAACLLLKESFVLFLKQPQLHLFGFLLAFFVLKLV